MSHSSSSSMSGTDVSHETRDDHQADLLKRPEEIIDQPNRRRRKHVQGKTGTNVRTGVANHNNVTPQKPPDGATRGYWQSVRQVYALAILLSIIVVVVCAIVVVTESSKIEEKLTQNIHDIRVEHAKDQGAREEEWKSLDKALNDLKQQVSVMNNQITEDRVANKMMWQDLETTLKQISQKLHQQQAEYEDLSNKYTGSTEVAKPVHTDITDTMLRIAKSIGSFLVKLFRK